MGKGLAANRAHFMVFTLTTCAINYLIYHRAYSSVHVRACVCIAVEIQLIIICICRTAIIMFWHLQFKHNGPICRDRFNCKIDSVQAFWPGCFPFFLILPFALFLSIPFNFHIYAVDLIKWKWKFLSKTFYYCCWIMVSMQNEAQCCLLFFFYSGWSCYFSWLPSMQSISAKQIRKLLPKIH